MPEGFPGSAWLPAGAAQPLGRLLSPGSLELASQRPQTSGPSRLPLAAQAPLVLLWLLALTASLSLQEKVVSYPKLDFSVQELRERFQQQLEMELNSTITIQSVESTKPLTPQALRAVSSGCLGPRVESWGRCSPWGWHGPAGSCEGGSSLLVPSDPSGASPLPGAAQAAGHPARPVARGHPPGPAEGEAQHVPEKDDVRVQQPLPLPVPAAR